MAKSKLIPRTKPMKVEVNNVVYHCTRKNGKITVRIARTARGQSLIAGIYDTEDGIWFNENNNTPLPSSAKNKIIEMMSMS